jgi:sterol 14-demethylase
MVEEECRSYLERWGDEGEINLFTAMAEMIVFTATRCLHGHETRKAFDETVANLYHDLDGGFSPLAWFFPPWVPFPSFKKRDIAHNELKKRFHEVVEDRRKDGQDYDDLLDTFIKANYTKVNDQRKLNNEETSGLLIALLMAGQHTSSTTSTWLGFFMCKENGLQQKLYEEQKKVMGDRGAEQPITTLDLEKMPLLHSVTRETLRLRPPIMQMMRNVREKITVTALNGEGKEVKYDIPAGNQVCVSPSVNGRNPEEWKDCEEFQSTRFVNEEGEVTHGEHLDPEGKPNKFKWVPFGAGRHRCIGFEFAQLQIRCVWSTMLRMFELELPTGEVPKVNYRTMIHTPLDPMIKYKRRVPLNNGGRSSAPCSSNSNQ